MTDPVLNYASPPPHRSAALRTVTWIMLLIIGYLLSAVGAFGTVIVVFLVSSSFDGPFALSLTEFWFGVVECILFVAATLGSGITYMWSSVKIRGHAPGSAKTALKWVLVNLALVLLMFLVNQAQNLLRGMPSLEVLLLPLAIYGTGMATEGALAYGLYRLTRERAFEGTP